LNQPRYILIAEDSKTQADVLTYILKEAGYEVIAVESGKDAIISIKERIPDMILTDIVMPEMDGYELCHKIKTDPHLLHIPVILLTQLYDPEDIIRGLTCGANNFIIKPYEKTGLLSCISSVLNPHPDNTGEKEHKLVYNGTEYQVLSQKNDILNILLSIYDTAVSRNVELEQTTERLNILTGSLEELVEERTEALKRTTITIEQLLMQKNELITKIGHDLNTPLTPLVALLPHVQKYEQNNELKEILDVLVKDVNVLKGLVGQTMKLSLLNQESFSMAEANINIKRVVDEVISGYAFSIKQLNIAVHNHIPSDLTIFLSPFHATTVFENLISNAIKYNIRGGTIIFRATKGENSNIITITDNGIGLSSEEAQQVFDEFYKADPSRHDNSSHGLGLSIVHRVVEMCGGKIQVFSQGKGSGTTFQVTLPKKRIKQG